MLAAWSVKRLHSHDMLVATFDGFHAIATALVIYGIAELAGGYGFLAVFAGGLAFRRYERDHELNASVHEGAERLEKLLELAVILLLGSMLTATGLGAIGWEGWLVAALLLVVVRPLAVLLSLVGSKMDQPDEKAFVAWFGVRGVGTLYYLAAIVTAGALGAAEQELVVWTCIAARAPLDRRPRPDGRAVAAPAAAQAATCSTASDDSRSAMRSSTAASSAG